MSVFSALNKRLFYFYILIIVIVCSPVWGVEYYVNQDGSPHLYNAYLMSELLKENARFAAFYDFNSVAVPNSSGHWLLVLLLQFFSPFLVTKLIVTLTFAGFVASIGWLRYKTAGASDLKTSLLIGAALGLNWMWLLGFYNFIIGVICFVFTIAAYSKWRDRMTVPRTIALSLLFLLAYFSHVVSFGMLVGSVFVLGLFSNRSHIKRNLILTAAAVIPVVPLAIIFKMLSTSGGSFFPVWRSLETGWTVANVIYQLRSLDPFVFISRRSFPFTDAASPLFVIFTPLLWIGIAFVFLGATTLKKLRSDAAGYVTLLPFAPLFILSVAGAIVGPDDFGLSHGGILRQRLLLCGFCFFVPLFRTEMATYAKRFAQICLAFVIIFQTIVVWDYAIHAEVIAKEFLSSQAAISDEDSIASVVIVKNGTRFAPIPEPQLNTLAGIGRNHLIWDNYELGHYLFPVVARNAIDREFILDLSATHAFSEDDLRLDFKQTLEKLEHTLDTNHHKLNKIILFGRNKRVEDVLNKWFEEQPIFANGQVRVFQHKAP